MAGKIQYHKFIDLSVDKKDGVLMKMPIKDGITSRDPIKYHVFLFPAGQLSLSEQIPTIGVVNPSAIYPESSAAAAIPG